MKEPSNKRDQSVMGTFIVLACVLLWVPTAAQPETNCIPYWFPGMRLGLDDYSVAGITMRALQGDARAALALGSYYDSAHDVTNAVKFMSVAASMGDPDAQMEFGEMLMRDGPARDFQRARHWFGVAATNGLSISARRNLARLDYRQGIGNHMVSLEKAIRAVLHLHLVGEYITFGDRDQNPTNEITKALSEVKDGRTLVQILLMLRLLKSEADDSVEYQQFIQDSMNYCLEKIERSDQRGMLIGEKTGVADTGRRGLPSIAPSETHEGGNRSKVNDR